MRTLSVLVILFGIGLFVTWCMNIVKLINAPFDSGVTVETVLRVVGIFLAPLGSVMGLL